MANESSIPILGHDLLMCDRLTLSQTKLYFTNSVVMYFELIPL